MRNANAQNPVATCGIVSQFALCDMAKRKVSHRLPVVSRDLLVRSRPGASPGDLGDFFSTHAHEIEEGERKEAGNRRENRRRGSLPRLPNAPEALADRAGAGRHAGAKAPVWGTSCPRSHAGGGRTRVQKKTRVGHESRSRSPASKRWLAPSACEIATERASRSPAPAGEKDTSRTRVHWKAALALETLILRGNSCCYSCPNSCHFRYFSSQSK